MARWLCRAAATPGKIRPFSDSLGIFCPMPTARSKPHCDMWSVICQAQTHDECKVLLQVFPAKFNYFYSREDIYLGEEVTGKMVSLGPAQNTYQMNGDRVRDSPKCISRPLRRLPSSSLATRGESGPLADAAMTPK